MQYIFLYLILKNHFLDNIYIYVCVCVCVCVWSLYVLLQTYEVDLLWIILEQMMGKTSYFLE